MSGPLNRSSRRTTKRFVWTNIILAWGTIWACLALAPEALQWLAVPVLGLIVGLFAFYTGTGTADMFAVLRRNAGDAPPYGSQANDQPMNLDPGTMGGRDDIRYP